jgi:hypothetical protein
LRGATDPSVYRASGLFIHLLSVTLIFWMFRLTFPGSPPIAAFVSAISFLLNRTALVTSTSVTQHLPYALFAAVALFFAALYFRTRDRPFWYASCAALGLSFATVETSFILVVVFLVLLPLATWWDNRKAMWGLLGRGALFFTGAVLIVWPKGILQLGTLKGYAYLGYMAVIRKTFTEITPVQLWGLKLKDHPEEYLIGLGALFASAILWKRMPDRRALLPFIVYGFLFIGITMIITAPYTYYHVSLTVATSVLTGVVFGWLWNRGNPVVRAAAVMVIAVPLLWMPVTYYRELAAIKAAHDPRTELLVWVSSAGPERNSLVLPYVLMPTLHFYDPQIHTTTYDVGAEPAGLADLVEQPNHTLLCEEALCRAVRSHLSASVQTSQTRVMEADSDLQSGPLFALEVHAPEDQPPNR